MTNDPLSVLTDLHAAVDAVFFALENHDDWGFSGNRPDQYTFDVVADSAIREVLSYNGYGLLSEESPMVPATKVGSPLVVVDPVDGSTNAFRQLPWFSTSLCAVDDQGPWVAVVANLANGNRYEAVRGDGARSKEGKIFRTVVPELSDSLIAVSGLPKKNLGWGQFRNLGSAALALCAIADGSLDGFVDCSEDAHGVWDYLGGMLICSEAGGLVVDAKGRELCVRNSQERRTPVAGANLHLLKALLEGRQSF